MAEDAIDSEGERSVSEAEESIFLELREMLEAEVGFKLHPLVIKRIFEEERYTLQDALSWGVYDTDVTDSAISVLSEALVDIEWPHRLEGWSDQQMDELVSNMQAAQPRLFMEAKIHYAQKNFRGTTAHSEEL